MGASIHDMARSNTVDRVSEMTNVVRIKQGFTEGLFGGPGPKVRYVDRLQSVLDLVPVGIKEFGTVPLNYIASIHYARWVILPDKEHLLFTTNFDGGFDQYIHDFVTVANGREKTRFNPQGMPFIDMIWGNCVGYPGTDNFEEFLLYLRSTMVDTTLFFPTISSSTVRDVEWLRRFRSHFETFDAAAQTVPREAWPPELLAAYDVMKAETNRIDVTVV